MTQIKFLSELNMTSASPVYNLSFLLLLPFNCQAQMQLLLPPGADKENVLCRLLSEWGGPESRSQVNSKGKKKKVSGWAHSTKERGENLVRVKAGPKKRSQYSNPRLNTQAVSSIIHCLSSRRANEKTDLKVKNCQDLYKHKVMM